jgi:DNA replication protein DnaC
MNNQHYATEGDGKPAAPAPEKSCPRCIGTGWYNTEETPPGYPMAVTMSHKCDCESALNHHRAEWAIKCRVPVKWRQGWQTFAPVTPAHKIVCDQAMEYSAGFHRGKRTGMLFTGRAGSGKSHLAGMLTYGVTQGGFTALWYNVPELLKALRASFDDPSKPTEAEILAQCAAVDLLTLDDLGADRGTDYAIESLFSIINARVELEKATVFTTNLTSAEIEKTYTERIRSRIFRIVPFGSVVHMPLSDYNTSRAGRLTP